MNWSFAATRSQQAFRKGDEAALLKNTDLALLYFAEARAWLELAMHLVEREK